ncbi:MAG: RHS repeat-associated core domain-containing protein [Flavobacteriales bacterium]
MNRILYLTEKHIYGSSRLGMDARSVDMFAAASATDNGYFEEKRGEKRYELSNQLGNVLVVLSDQKLATITGANTLDYYTAEVLSYNDYYPFGAPMHERSGTNGGGEYRYGFNGKENDNEAETQDYGFRIYNTRLGKFLSVDPLSKEYPWNSAYAFAENDVIQCIDLDGAERIQVTQWMWNVDGTRTKLAVVTEREDEWEKGTIYEDEYYFRKSSGEFKYYSIKNDAVRGSAIMSMRADNPAYFRALGMYHQYQQDKTNRMVGDGLIIIGGIVTTVISGGTGTGPYMAAFGVTTGIFAVGAGSAKMTLDGMGKFKEADEIPTSPLGGFGKVIDHIKGGGKMTYQNIGDLASTFINLFGGGLKEWKSWDAMKSTDRLIGAQDFMRGLYNAFGNGDMDEETIKQNALDFIEILNEYSRIKQANE